MTTRCTFASLVTGLVVIAGCGGASQEVAPNATGDASADQGSNADGGNFGEPDASRSDASDAQSAPDSDASIDASNKSDAGEFSCPPSPAGAAALGYGTMVFCLQPTQASVAYSNTVTSPLYSGSFSESTFPDASHYSDHNGALTISLGGGVATQRRNSTAGALPYLLAGSGFYVEFAVTLSDNNSDHWPAVWLLPQEHNLAKSDHLSTDPAGYERWMELDCDEGGFYSGSLHTLVDWTGIYPNYDKTPWNNYGEAPLNLDRTMEHVFGVSYDPVGQVAQYWLDGAKAYAHSTSTISPIINTYHYYLIMGAQSHGAEVPYEMTVRYASAWTK